jgi:hypothetical protein
MRAEGRLLGRRIVDAAFLGYLPPLPYQMSLDLRLEPCQVLHLGLSSDAAMTVETMLITVNTRTFLAEAAPDASSWPCRHSVDAKRQPGYVLALAGRCAS